MATVIGSFKVKTKKAKEATLQVSLDELRLLNPEGISIQRIFRKLVKGCWTNENATKENCRAQVLVEIDGRTLKAKYTFIGEDPLEDRRKFKELILMSKKKPAVVHASRDEVLRSRAKICAQDLEMRHMHNCLVVEGYMPPEEFWKKYYYDKWQWLQPFVAEFLAAHNPRDLLTHLKEKDNKSTTLDKREFRFLFLAARESDVFGFWDKLDGVLPRRGEKVVDIQEVVSFLHTIKPMKQDKGLSNKLVSAAFSHDGESSTKEAIVQRLIQRQNKSEDASRVQIELTGEEIHQIFVLMPEVYDAYLDFVPERMSEKQFWTKFCMTQYFQTHTNQVMSEGRNELDAVFDAHVKAIQDEKEKGSSPGKRKRLVNPMVDLTNAEESNMPCNLRRLDGDEEKEKENWIKRVNNHGSLLVKKQIDYKEEKREDVYDRYKIELAESARISHLNHAEKKEYRQLRLQNPEAYYSPDRPDHKRVKLCREHMGRAMAGSDWMMSEKWGGVSSSSAKNATIALTLEMKNASHIQKAGQQKTGCSTIFSLNPSRQNANVKMEPEFEKKLRAFQDEINELVRHYYIHKLKTKRVDKVKRLYTRLQIIKSQLSGFSKNLHDENTEESHGHAAALRPLISMCEVT